MIVDFTDKTNVIILGAGASVDYGLPTWLELNTLLKQAISTKNNPYQHGKEILEWIDKVGEEKVYQTVDECIATESVTTKYRSNGDEIENEIFKIFRDIFTEKYNDNEDGWIKLLNEKILRDIKLENHIGFINYNYDNVLDKNFLNFDYLPSKHRRHSFKNRLGSLKYTTVPVFHPHGFLYEDVKTDHVSHVSVLKETIKTGDPEHIDAISCFDSPVHSVTSGVYNQKRRLHILGLGGGLKMNLDKLRIMGKIQEINITIRNKETEGDTLEFLSKKFEVPINEIGVYMSCEELIEKCF